MLLENAGKPTRERLTLIRIFEELRALGYEGSYDGVRRYAKRWRAERGAAMAEAYVPLSSAPGEAYQFDWSHEVVLINGTTVTVKVAHVRLCHSRMLFVRAYPRETQEMVFDAHNRAFAFFKGTCTRGIYDNMKTAVETVFIGKEAEWGGLECASRRPGLSRRGPKHKVSCGPSAIGERRDPVPSRLILSCPVPIWVPKTPRSGCRSSQARTVE